MSEHAATYLADYYLDPAPHPAQAAARETAVAGMHHENLYDVDEDGAGERYDLGTGRPFENSLHTDETILLSSGYGYELSLQGDSADADPEFTNDPAALWLAEHDPTQTA